MIYKDMCNDIRKHVAVYIISIPIERILSGRAESPADFTQDLFYDIISLIFYYEIAKNVRSIHGEGFKSVVAKNAILLTVNEYLTNKKLTLTKFSSSMAITSALYFITKPTLALVQERTGINTSNFEESLGSIVALSLANNSIYDTAAKAISLFIFHYALKW